MNLFTRNSPYYHLLKYLLFLLKHPVYIYILELYYVKKCLCESHIDSQVTYVAVKTYREFYDKL
jgi:hypothetical protein